MPAAIRKQTHNPTFYIGDTAERKSLGYQTHPAGISRGTVIALHLALGIRYNAWHDMKSSPEIKFQLAILAESPAPMDGLGDIGSIEWLGCKQTGEFSFDFCKGDVIISSVNLEEARFDLPNLLGVIVVGTENTFEAIKNKWSSGLPSLKMTFRRIPKWDNNDILHATIECIADDLAFHRRHSGRAVLELATYRREFDRLQRCFSRLEEYVGSRSFQCPIEIFEYPPNSVSATGTSGKRRLDDVTGSVGHSLIQYLPVNSLGLSSFSIHISAKPETGAEPLRIKLKVIETQHIFGTWSIEAGEERKGWVELALQSAIDEPALSLEIIVEWPRDNWGLALGPPHPYKEFCARTEAGEHLRAPISLRVFSSLPGVRVPATTTAIRPIDAPHLLSEFIPYDVYEAVSQVIPQVQDNKPTLVFYDRDIGCITVHPHIGGLTAGRMNVVVPKHAWRISAQIHLAHERASPTQFGLMVCAPRDESGELARLVHPDVSTPAFSGWKSVSALETKSVSVLLAASQEERPALYLVTRQAPDLSSDFAWARFSKLEFNILPESLIAEKETDELAPVAGDSYMPARNT